jgi:hypothetical protein
MIDTKKKDNLIKLMVEMGRRPPHLTGLIDKEYFLFSI